MPTGGGHCGGERGHRYKLTPEARLELGASLGTAQFLSYVLISCSCHFVKCYISLGPPPSLLSPDSAWSAPGV